MSATRSSSRLAAKPRVDYFEDDNLVPEEEIPMAERFIKLLRKDENHHGLQFKTGLNVDIQPWRSQIDCAPGGIYFCRLNQLHRWLDLYNDVAWCRWVSIPADAELVDCGDLLKFKANKVILSERVPIEEIIRKYFDIDELCKLKPLAAAFMDPSDPKFIKYIRNERTGSAFRALKSQPPELSIEMVSKDWRLLQYVREQTPEICLAAVKQNNYAIVYVREQTPEICMAAVNNDGYALQYVRKMTQELCDVAVEKTPYAMHYVPTQFKTPDLCMSVVQRQPRLLCKVDSQTFDLCMAAVSRDGYALQFVKLPATESRLPELYAAAVAQHGCALKFVPLSKRTYELSLAAVKQNGYALYHVLQEHQTRELCDVAVAQAKHAAKYIMVKDYPTAAAASAASADFFCYTCIGACTCSPATPASAPAPEPVEQKKANGLKAALMNLTNKLHAVKVHPSA